jgi:hypothetical protein
MPPWRVDGVDYPATLRCPGSSRSAAPVKESPSANLRRTPTDAEALQSEQYQPTGRRGDLPILARRFAAFGVANGSLMLGRPFSQ